jgi:hypothetical protein
LDAALGGALQAVYVPDIYCADADYFGAFAGRLNVGCHWFRLLNVAANDAGVGTQMHKGSNLGAADGTCSTGTEDYFVFLDFQLAHVFLFLIASCMFCRTKYVISPHVAEIGW